MIRADPEGVAEVRKITSVQFGVLSPDTIRKMSVAEIKYSTLKEASFFST
jgi:DNA-directed RNA polymerase beta' subunit